MNILLVYPRYPNTYWSFKYALKFIAKRASNIPLGLITVSSLLPQQWNKKLVDLNVSNLRQKHIKWADYVFISAMSVQIESVREIIKKCKQLNKKIVAGGSLFTEEHELFPEIDHLILNEAEITLPTFIKDLQSGMAQKIYQTNAFADIVDTPLPDYSLLNLKKYATAAIQYSRGCPFDCEFCDITALFGHKVRTKSTHQILLELERILKSGWKGSVFFVDDNFIGNRNKLKRDLLPEIIQWMQLHKHPFQFITEASINLADDHDLMKLMVEAGFTKVFVGIETPDKNSLAECNKIQNNERDLLNNVLTIQQYGLEVTAGFIVGFDHDQPNIFQRQIDFIQNSGIITAMVGLLNAPRLSKLYTRLHEEGRILNSFSGDNTDYSMNFTPVMNREVLMKGYQRIIHEIYSSKSYYTRVKTFLLNYNPPSKIQTSISFQKLLAFIRSVLYIGILQKNRAYYWKLLFWSLWNKPATFPLAVTYSIYGYHFRKVFKGIQ